MPSFCVSSTASSLVFQSLKSPSVFSILSNGKNKLKNKHSRISVQQSFNVRHSSSCLVEYNFELRILQYSINISIFRARRHVLAINWWFYMNCNLVAAVDSSFCTWCGWWSKSGQEIPFCVVSSLFMWCKVKDQYPHCFCLMKQVFSRSS